MFEKLSEVSKIFSHSSVSCRDWERVVCNLNIWNIILSGSAVIFISLPLSLHG